MTQFIQLTHIVRFGDTDGTAVVVNVARIDSFTNNSITVNGVTHLVAQTAAEIWHQIEKTLDNPSDSL